MILNHDLFYCSRLIFICMKMYLAYDLILYISTMDLFLPTSKGLTESPL